MGQVNRYPAGYLSLLDAQTGGRAPQSTLDEIRPILDLFPYLDLLRQEEFEFSTSATVTEGVNVGTAGAVNTFVPQDEIWYLKHMTIAATELAVGTTYRVAPCAILPLLTVTPKLLAPPETFTASQLPAMPATLLPCWLPSGSRLAVWCNELIAGTALVFRIGAVITRYRV